MNQDQALLLRSDLLRQGYTASAIRHRVATGQWAREMRGCYIDLRTSSEAQEAARRMAWLQLAGANAVLSHDTAAIFHGFDSTNGWDTETVWITQPVGKRPPDRPGFQFVRSRTLLDDPAVVENGFRYTSRVRTLLDVLARCDLHEGERVLESALRGPDPKRPDRWRQGDLLKLQRWVREHPRQPGVQQARLLLAQRPSGCRPTGSIAETAALQAIRGSGLGDPIRQAHVVAPDEFDNPRDHFLDLFLDGHVADVEVDGGQHNDGKRRAADLQRDRRLAAGMAVIRFTAHEALFQPDRVVAVVKEELRRRAHEARFVSSDSLLTGADLEWRIERPLPPTGTVRTNRAS